MGGRTAACAMLMLIFVKRATVRQPLLGERLFPKKIQAVYSSDLLRAVETAQAANLYWNVEHTICPELREIDFGEMEGLSDEEIAVKFADFKKEQAKMETDLAYPGGECAADVVKRADPVLKGLVKQDMNGSQW